ncbi:MAG: ThuA domain-containing protein, partial [Akkermansiaceae bacterium]|nr:ThuA domain-containing protein [Akkermansiaceae bacterium]
MTNLTNARLTQRHGARKEGKGRVYYTTLGHRDDVWTNLTFQNMLIGAIQWAKCEANAAIPPNLKTTAPESTPP